MRIRVLEKSVLSRIVITTATRVESFDAQTFLTGTEKA